MSAMTAAMLISIVVIIAVTWSTIYATKKAYSVRDKIDKIDPVEEGANNQYKQSQM